MSTPPRIAFVPHFVQLSEVARCSRMAVAVYGVIAAYHAKGWHPSVREIAWLCDHKDKRHVYRALVELLRACLVRRARAGARTHYELLGPTLEMYTQQHGETGT